MNHKKVLLVILGGGLAAATLVRLALNEVQLASQQAESEALRQEVAHASSASENATRLALEVARARERSSGLEAKLAAARADAASIDKELATADTRLARLRKATFSAQADLSKATRDVARLTRARAEARQRVAALDKKLTSATREAARLGKELARSKRRAEQLDARLVASQGALAKEREAATALRASLKATQSSLAKARAEAIRNQRTLAKLKQAGVNVDRLSGAKPMPVLSAIVVQVDRKRVPPVVLVNAGSQVGVEKKDTLYVIRSGRQIARLEVDTVSAHLCSGRIVQGIPGKMLLPGDQVRSRPPRPD